MNHTEGPWQIKDDEIADSKGHPVLQIGCLIDEGGMVPGVDDCERQANLKLMAAAPEILDSLIELRDWISSWDPNFIEDDEWPEARDRMRAAIKKATE